MVTTVVDGTVQRERIKCDGHNNKRKRRKKNSSIIRHTSMVLNGCTVITIEKFCIRLILWLWMKWCGLTTTKHHIMPIYAPVNWIYFFYHFVWGEPKKTIKKRCFSWYKNRWFSVLAWNFEFVFCTYWLHMTATGDWLRKILHLTKFQCFSFTLLFSWSVLRWQTDNKMYSIKLLDNCYLFEWRSVCGLASEKQRTKKIQEYFLRTIGWKSIKMLCKRWHTLHT